MGLGIGFEDKGDVDGRDGDGESWRDVVTGRFIEGDGVIIFFYQFTKWRRREVYA